MTDKITTNQINQSELFEAKSTIPIPSKPKEKLNILNTPYNSKNNITAKAFIQTLPTIQKTSNIYYSQRKKSNYFSHSFFKNQNPQISIFNKKKISKKKI